jgi:cytoskeletal protein CcmA (bactofilin family)
MSTLSQAGFGQGNLLAMLFFGGVFWKGWGDMFNLLQLLAMVTLGSLGVVLLIRSGKRWTTMAMVMSAMAGLLVLPPAAAAAEVSKGKQSYTLAEGETLNNDLIVMTGTARIEGTLNGDLIVFGRSVTIDGHVTGDVIGFAQRLTINGKVDGDIRVITGTFGLKGQVGKNVTAFVSTIELDSKAEIGGSLTLFAEQAGLEGKIGRDILAFGETFDLNGLVGGNVLMQGVRLNIGSRAEIPGKIKFRGRNKPEVADGAKLSGTPEFEELKRRRGRNYGSLKFYMWEAVWWGASFLFGLVLALVAPKFFREAVRSGDRYGPSLGAGLVALILTPVLACIACFTLVGIPLAIAAVLLWAIAMYGAQVFLGTWLGNKLMGEPAGTGATLGRMAIGLLAIHVVVNLPYIGGWARLVVILLGMGAMTLAIYKRMQAEGPVAA